MPFRSAIIALSLSAAVHAWAGLSLRSWTVSAPEPNDPTIAIAYLKYVTAPAPPVRKAAPPAARVPLRQMQIEEIALPPPPPRLRPAPIRQSRDLLADPKDAKLFTNYYGAVKERIHQTIRRKYSRESVGEGSVTLIFILNRFGILESAWVSGRPSALTGPQQLALRALKSSAPFESFPKDLSAGRIAFTVTVLFEEI